MNSQAPYGTWGMALLQESHGYKQDCDFLKVDTCVPTLIAKVASKSFDLILIPQVFRLTVNSLASPQLLSGVLNMTTT